MDGDGDLNLAGDMGAPVAIRGRAQSRFRLPSPSMFRSRSPTTRGKRRPLQMAEGITWRCDESSVAPWRFKFSRYAGITSAGAHSTLSTGSLYIANTGVLDMRKARSSSAM